MPWDIYFTRCTVPSDGVTHFSALFVTTTERVVICDRAGRTAGFSCYWMIVGYACYKYCNIMSIFPACNSRVRTETWEFALHYSVRRHPDANAFRRLEQHLLETWRATHTVLVNAGCPLDVRVRTSEYAIIAAVERELWRSRHATR